MFRNYKNIFKLISKYGFILIIVIIVIIFIFNRAFAIWFTLVLILLFSLWYLPTLTFKGKIVKLIKENSTLADDDISQKLRRPIEEIREKISKLSKNQKRKKWLIVFLNKRYVSYNKETIKKFMELYLKGYHEKEIHENLKKQVNIRTRAEIKAIENTLNNQHRLVDGKETLRKKSSIKIKNLKKKY